MGWVIYMLIGRRIIPIISRKRDGGFLGIEPPPAFGPFMVSLEIVMAPGWVCLFTYMLMYYIC